jgi:hypothetical protein
VARPKHPTGHPRCPHPNWAACDRAVAARFGPCKALVGNENPHPCTRMATGEEGWCGQHVISELERERRESHIAIRQAELDRRVDRFMEWVKDHPSVWDSPAD